jgi:hypothetical protein
MNHAELAGIFDAMEKAAQDPSLLAKHPPAGGGSEADWQEMRGKGTGKSRDEMSAAISRVAKKPELTKTVSKPEPSTKAMKVPSKVKEKIREAGTQVKKRTGLSEAASSLKNVASKAPAATRALPKKTQMLRSAVDVAKKDPGGKMHKLLAQRAKLLKAAEVLQKWTATGARGTESSKKLQQLMRKKKLVVTQGGNKAHDVLMKTRRAASGA